MATHVRIAFLALLTLMLAACSGEQLVGIHITLNEDGSGTVTTRALVEPAVPSPIEKATEGADWTPAAQDEVVRAAVVATRGRFERLDALRFGDGGLHFATNLGGEQHSLRVYLHRARDAAWVKAFAPDAKTRKDMARIYDPSGSAREIGGIIRVEIELPGEVVASSVHPTARGVEADRERKRAFLLLPVRTMLTNGEEMVWDVTWR